MSAAKSHLEVLPRGVQAALGMGLTANNDEAAFIVRQVDMA